MTKTNLATVLALIPRSDEQLARNIGISSKTIKRIRSWDYKCWRISELRIVNYLNKLWLSIIDYMKEASYAKNRYELSDYPDLYFIASRDQIKKQ
jgi:transcriptional regulator with XRE-family HTH domain